MKTQGGNAKEIRNNSLAGIAVMNEDVSRADALLEAVKAEGTLLTFDGNRFKSYAAVDPMSLGGLSDFQVVLERAKIRYCLALAVPVSDLQTEPDLDASGSASRILCSANGLPFRTQSEQQDSTGAGKYEYAFRRPSFWLVKVVSDGVENVFYATLFGQFRNPANNQLEYRPVTRKSFDTESNLGVENPVTKVVKGGEQAARELNINSGFLYAMVKPTIDLAEGQRRRQGLIASVGREAQPFTTKLGELFPGLANVKVTQPAVPAKPAKKVKKTKPELAVAE